MNKETIKATLIEIEQCMDAFNKKYRKQDASYIKFNLDDYSDEEIHAETGYSVMLVSSALLSVVHDQSFTSFARAATRITRGYIGLRESLNVLNTNRHWAYPRSRKHLEAFVKFCFGLFEIVIACMPAKLSRFLNFIGFSGHYRTGIEYLEEAFAIKNTFAGQVSGLTLTFIYTVVEFIYGLGEIKLDVLKMIKIDCLAIHPDSAYTTMVCASIHFYEADWNQTISLCNEKLIESSKQPKYIKFILRLLISLSFAFQCKWREAAEGMEILLEAKWAKALMHYAYGSFLFMAMISEGTRQHEEELEIIFKKIPSLCRRIGGRKTFYDNFVSKRSQKYFLESRKHFLPAYELFYVLNLFNVIEKNRTFMELMLKDIVSHLECGEDDFASYDDFANLLFLKAIIFKHLNQMNEAIDLLCSIINNGNRIKNDKFILAHATFEIGRIYEKNNNLIDARLWITKSKNDYSRFLT
ncbi:Tetratricopeptide repeat protein 39B-like protein, partial [Dinothrombium tinctorium]